MIKMSTKGRYALRAMVDLASHGDTGPVPRGDIAERQDVSADYMAQLFTPLQDAGLVEGVRGPGGGYRLARAPEDIRVSDIVEIVEGPVALAPCVGQQPEASCPRSDGCPTRAVWEHVSTHLKTLLASYSLADLCRRDRE